MNGSAAAPGFSAAEIAGRLGKAAHGTDGWWNARCPAHQDSKASLGLKDTEDGGVAYRCMAGCDAKTVGDALKALDLLPEHVRPEKPARGKIVATYPYHDEAGHLLFEVVRFKPKDFRQRRPDPSSSDGWIWRLGDVRRVLYRLPELLRADPTERVYLVEGEKDVDRLRSLGFVATTNPQGAGKWAKTDGTALHGRHVVIVPDQDEPGLKHARAIALDLQGKAASVLTYHGLGEHKDVSAWLDAGGTAEVLRVAV